MFSFARCHARSLEICNGIPRFLFSLSPTLCSFFLIFFSILDPMGSANLQCNCTWHHSYTHPLTNQTKLENKSSKSTKTIATKTSILWIQVLQITSSAYNLLRGSKLTLSKFDGNILSGLFSYEHSKITNYDGLLSIYGYSMELSWNRICSEHYN